jgi:hypothetical protein
MPAERMGTAEWLNITPSVTLATRAANGITPDNASLSISNLCRLALMSCKPAFLLWMTLVFRQWIRQTMHTH